MRASNGVVRYNDVRHATATTTTSSLPMLRMVVRRATRQPRLRMSILTTIGTAVSPYWASTATLCVVPVISLVNCPCPEDHRSNTGQCRRRVPVVTLTITSGSLTNHR